MEQIQKVILHALQNEEVFGFFSLVEEELKNLPAGPEGGAAPLKAAKEAFVEKLSAFDGALETPGKLASVREMAEAAAEANEAWRASCAYVKVMMRHPDLQARDAARQYLAVYDNYGNPTKMARLKELGILENLCADLDTLGDGEALGFAPWKRMLAGATAKLKAALGERTDEQSRVQVGLVKETRLAAEAAYRRLADCVNVAASYEGDAAYATFISHLNALVERQKIILKTRAALNKKKG